MTDAPSVRDQQDIALVETAREAGAEVREKTSVTEVVWRGGRAVGVRCATKEDEYEIHAALVVGADGRRSKVAAEVGAWEPYRASKNGRGFVFRYLDDPLGDQAPDALEIHRAEGDQVLVPSCPAGRTLVVNMTDAADIPTYRQDFHGQWEAMIERNPTLKARIGGATNESKPRMTDDLSSYYRRASGPGWALAGDAGHFKDPVAGNGMRDALKFGRRLGETAAVTLDDPQRLDAALRDWEAERDDDTLSTYHWANRESRPGPTSPLTREVLRTFAGSDEPNFSDTFNRARPVESVIHPGRLVRGLVRALTAPGADRKAILKEAWTEVPMELSLRRHRFIDGFRSSRPTSTERAGWSVGEPNSPPSYRPAAPGVERLPAGRAPGAADAHRSRLNSTRASIGRGTRPSGLRGLNELKGYSHMATLQPVGEDFFDSAPARYSRQFLIDQPAAAVWEELVGDKPLHWCRALDVSWTSPRPFSIGTTRQAKVLGGILKVQEHFFLWEEGRRYAFYVTEANAPLFTSLAEDYTVEPRGAGQCAFTWTIALTPTTLGKAGGPMNGPLFNSFFNDTAKYFAAATDRSR